MGFINNLKTKTKLLLSFAVILVITAVIGVNGLMTPNRSKATWMSFKRPFSYQHAAWENAGGPGKSKPGDA